MARRVIEYLDAAARKYPEKTAFADAEKEISFSALRKTARSIGKSILSQGICRGPVAVLMEKNVDCAAAFLGVAYSGSFYCPLDCRMPAGRLNTILSVLEAKLLITSRSLKERLGETSFSGTVLVYEEISQWGEVGEEAGEEVGDEVGDGLERALSLVTEQDPLYVLFTSGSTGVPKGVLVGERVVTNYLEWLGKTFPFTSEDVFGNQAPFYFDVSVHDIYAALYFGARMEIIPPSYFSFPIKLVEYMNERRITAFLWVPSAMGIVANLDVFRFACPKDLKYVMFAGEVLPRKHLEYWRRYLPGAVYANLYGPTETFVCTAYVLEAGEAGEEPLPIGKPIDNAQAVILGEDGLLAKEGEEGELCLRGSCLAIGYYGDPERTKASFIQNPGCTAYPERIYRTGDLVRRDKDGNLIYLSRRDYQIKHMGYRIELGEIEAAAAGIEGINDCACIYDGQKKQIILCYDGKELGKRELEEQLSKKLPPYMMPGKFRFYPGLPHNANGKIDRKKLSQEKFDPKKPSWKEPGQEKLGQKKSGS